MAKAIGRIMLCFVQMAEWKPLPSTVLGVLVLVAGSLILLLPETRGKPIYDTIEQIEASVRYRYI